MLSKTVIAIYLTLVAIAQYYDKYAGAIIFEIIDNVRKCGTFIPYFTINMCW